jgi:hypothetical protein
MLLPQFKGLWERIKHKTRYAVKINTETLLAEVAAELDGVEIRPPRVTIKKAQVHVGDNDEYTPLQMTAGKTVLNLAGRYPLPNLVEIMTALMENTSPPVRLTRSTLLEVFKRYKNKQAATDNPQALRSRLWALSCQSILATRYSISPEGVAAVKTRFHTLDHAPFLRQDAMSQELGDRPQGRAVRRSLKIWKRPETQKVCHPAITRKTPEAREPAVGHARCHDRASVLSVSSLVQNGKSEKCMAALAFLATFGRKSHILNAERGP